METNIWQQVPIRLATGTGRDQPADYLELTDRHVAGIVGGLLDKLFFGYLLIYSAFRALLFIVFCRFDVRAFPVQVHVG
jgi:hypothetical protein